MVKVVHKPDDGEDKKSYWKVFVNNQPICIFFSKKDAIDFVKYNITNQEVFIKEIQP